jgi:hypothetical protein
MNYGDNNNVFLEDFGKIEFFVNDKNKDTINSASTENVDMSIYGISNNKAFMLVELIVVITILAVLGTI